MNSLTLYRKTSSGWPPTSYKYYNNLQEIQQMSSINIQIPKLIEPFKAFPRTSWEFPFLCLCFTIIWFLFCLCNTLVLMCFLTLTIREISTPASVPFFQMVSWQFQVFVLYYSFSVVFFFFFYWVITWKCGQTLNSTLLLGNRLSISKRFSPEVCR